MKRIVVAIAILLTVAALCMITLTMQTRTINDLLSVMDQIQETYDHNEIDECIKTTNKFVEEFNKRTRFFPFFMRHSDASKIEETVVTLPVLLKAENKEHFEAELTKCHSMLEKLAELETPSLENIL